jgi:hypothetical protein
MARIQHVGQDITLESGADLSTHQFKFVKGVAAIAGGQNARVDTAGANERMIGVLQNKPLLGQGAVVRVAGRSKLQTDTSAILVGSPLRAGALGVATLAGADKDKVGAISLEANAGAAIIVDALLMEYDLAV